MSKALTAAGGLIWRPARRGIAVAVIHRPHRGDWSLPKGGIIPGERPVAAAHREVVEETGLQVAVQQRLSVVRYKVDGTNKTVDYWAMRYVGGRFRPNPEADELTWLPPPHAVRQLTFDADRELVTTFAAEPPVSAAILLVRHARAGKRSTWTKDDHLRPIDTVGRRQAEALADLAVLFAPDAIYSAPPARCRQTVAPLAARLDLPVVEVPELGDAGFDRHPKAAVRALLELADDGVSVVSSQGSTIPGLLGAVDAAHAPHDSQKGSMWVALFTDRAVTQADYYERA
ncbi:MAG: bifunctional NUDIX hydrolase/histidine phosphatase family protein [bacterium]